MFKKLLSSLSRTTPASTPAPATAGPVAATVQAPAPVRTGVLDLTKKAAFSLSKNGLDGQRAAVYLVLDRSGSMRRFYKDGTMQYLGERALGLSRALDDDGKVPVMFFSTDLDGTTVLELGNHTGRVNEVHAQLGHMGRTRYTRAISAVIEHYQNSGSTDPAFVLFQTDGSPDQDDRQDTEDLLTAAKELPMFWSFVGFGDNVAFLRTVDQLPGIDNTGFFHVPDPHRVSDVALYDGITQQFGPYLTAARTAGVLR
ncbi:VWA domain-containing protein [[Kitasatospora] papulosa]|uniref:VWA domain-containing protein n=1 Tax=[Kitasatospora] papulosa TaxID=1464011 RepID=UPI0036BDDB48